jgi:hypothetical protein
MVEASIALEARLAETGADADSWLAELRRDAEKFPRDPDAMLLLAEAECRRASYAACLEAAGQALERSPDNVRALSWKGLALAGDAAAKAGSARSGDLKAARATLARAIGLDGEAPLPRIAYFQSFTLAGEAVPDDAMAGMAQVVRIVPAAPGPRLSLGAELIRRGQPDLARKLLYPVLFGPYDTPERKQAQALLAAYGAAPNPG